MKFRIAASSILCLSQSCATQKNSAGRTFASLDSNFKNCSALAQELISTLQQGQTTTNKSRFIFKNMAEQFRIQTKGKVILYRGEKSGLHRLGIKSKALLSGRMDLLETSAQIVESGDIAETLKLIDNHTSGSHLSTFVSATFNPKLAQMFALRESETIYKIEVDANRVILDSSNLGGSGSAGEVLIIGEIYPEEIVAIKIKNTDENSELHFQDKNGTSWISRRLENHPNKEDKNVKNPSNWRLTK